MPDPPLLELLRLHTPALLQELDLVALYLTGSRARGTARDDSDVDLLVLPEQPTADPLSLSVEVAARLEPLLRTAAVDVVVLDLEALPLPLLSSVLRDAVLVACADHSARVAFEVAAMSRTLDFEIHAAPMRAALLEKTARGQR